MLNGLIITYITKLCKILFITTHETFTVNCDTVISSISCQMK